MGPPQSMFAPCLSGQIAGAIGCTLRQAPPLATFAPMTAIPPPLDDLPGFRRRIRIVPGARQVSAAVEDDIHCMAAILHHDGATIAAVESRTDRMPWTTCPGAAAVLAQTFTGLTLAEAPARARSAKRSNCTHLFDMADLAATHAADPAPTTYDVLVSDPIAGQSRAELRRNGKVLLAWDLQDDHVAQAEGRHLMALRDWIAALAARQHEPARILQWACLVAHGRTMPFEDQSDATRMPPSCFTFHPDRAPVARRIDERTDFSGKGREPLSHWDGARFAR